MIQHPNRQPPAATDPRRRPPRPNNRPNRPNRPNGGGGGGVGAAPAAPTTPAGPQLPGVDAGKKGAKGKNDALFDMPTFEQYRAWEQANPGANPFASRTVDPNNAYGSPYVSPDPGAEKPKKNDITPKESNPFGFAMTGAGQYWFNQNPEQLLNMYGMQSGIGGFNASAGYNDFLTQQYEQLYKDFKDAAGINPHLTWRQYTQTLFGADPRTVPLDAEGKPVTEKITGSGKGKKATEQEIGPLYADPARYADFVNARWNALSAEERGTDYLRQGAGPMRVVPW